MNSLRGFLLLVALLLSGLSVVRADDSVQTAGTPAASSALDSARQAIKNKDWNAALASLNVALKEEPRNADVHNLLGYSYRKQASPNLPKAFEHYRTALKLDPRHKGAHEYIGEAYLMARNPLEAEKHLAALETICGNRTCEEYADLAKAISAYTARNR